MENTIEKEMLTLFNKRIRRTSQNFEPGDLRKLTSAYKTEYGSMVREKNKPKPKLLPRENPSFNLVASRAMSIFKAPAKK